MRTGVLVIGAGVAGLAAALAIEDRPVVVVSESPLGRDLASAWAQGGVAAALASGDSPALHAADTLIAAAGIGDGEAANVLADEAPAAIETLIELGVPFARGADGALELGLEGAHARRRIVHVADATGAAITAALLNAVRSRANVHLLEGVRASRLLTCADGAVCGAILVAPSGETVIANADAVVLATGGFGGLFARTTTPLGSRGAGIAMAARAGAELADLEFVQFHPTAMRIAADPLPLVSEAVRGEGAVLIDESGTPIMDGIDPRRDLAPRDIVARAVADVERSGRAVFLDARGVIGASFAERFPGIFAVAMRAAIDPRVDPIPITPAAHYTIGGVVTNLAGRTSLSGLWACGEVAATGLHGANRLASNSLVEGLVFGTRVGRDIAAAATRRKGPRTNAGIAPSVSSDTADAEHLRRVRLAMTAGLGVVRDAAGMSRALDVFEQIETQATDSRVADAAFVAAAVARAALARHESRGAHQRADYPLADPRLAHRTLGTVEPAALARTS